MRQARDLYHDAYETLVKRSDPDAGYPLLNAVILDCLLHRIRAGRSRWSSNALRRLLERLSSSMPAVPADFWQRTDRINLRMVRCLVAGDSTNELAEALATDYAQEFEDASSREIDSVTK